MQKSLVIFFSLAMMLTTFSFAQRTADLQTMYNQTVEARQLLNLKVAGVNGAYHYDIYNTLTENSIDSQFLAAFSAGNWVVKKGTAGLINAELVADYRETTVKNGKQVNKDQRATYNTVIQPQPNGAYYAVTTVMLEDKKREEGKGSFTMMRIISKMTLLPGQAPQK